MFKWITTFLKCFLILAYLHSEAQRVAHIVIPDLPQARFAAAKLKKSLLQRNFEVSVAYSRDTSITESETTIILSTVDDRAWSMLRNDAGSLLSELKSEGFLLRVTMHHSNFIVIGKDAAGLMYGGLELAEQISVKGIDSITSMTRNPYMQMRGIKMNIPLDVRTPSYTDASDAGQNNIREMWDMDFWKEQIDSLASYRYNFISLWSLHPFPSLVKVPEYPKVALDDVHRSTIQWKEYYPTRGTGLDVPAITDHYEVIKKISMEEKIAFWREVMRYGKERNVDFYLITWNIFTNSTEGKYGITDDMSNPVTTDYFRKSVKQLFLTYPDLAGVGLTTGENMPEADFEQKENWAFETYGKGVLDAAEVLPDRKITFIHRQHETGALAIAEKFTELITRNNVNFIFSFKYAQAHVFSSTTQTFHSAFVNDIQAKGDLKTLWTLRNDDVYYFRWGAPDFVREFVKNIPYEISAGFYYGSDQYIWGREFLDRYPEGKREIELAKHWYHWMLWGRLGYDPTIKNSTFVRLLEERYPHISGGKLFDAWQSASMIYPLTTGFHWGALDFQWYIEACKSRPEPAQTPSGFHDINRFITLPPHKGTNFISIPDFVNAVVSNAEIKGISPLTLADSIAKQADHALALVKDIPCEGNLELFKTIEDIKAMSCLGKYYSHKIKAATALALFRTNQDKDYHDTMIKELNESALFWRYYSSTALAMYKNPLWTNRVGYVDWKDLYKYVLQDITHNGGVIKIPDMESTTIGMVLEAEDAEKKRTSMAGSVSGFSGSGYVLAKGSESQLQWTFEVSRAGEYNLEFRYLKPKSEYQTSTIAVNGKSAGAIILWASGSDKNWVWDRAMVNLSSGTNNLSISLPEGVALDYIKTSFIK
jgi:Carbohydrate binding module (family 35)/Glycosyl hydrolase family 67 N-terminus